MAFREENKVRAEKIDYDQKMDKYDTAITTHRNNIEHWKREMSKIKLHATEANPSPELNVLSEEELEGIRIETLKNSISKLEVELAKLSPNLQVKQPSFCELIKIMIFI